MQEETQVRKESKSGYYFGHLTEESIRISDPKGIDYMIIDDDDGYID